MAHFRVGVATIDMTPPVGLPLMGNFRDDYAARGVHDALRAKAMVFAGADNFRVALLVVDLCMVDRAGVAKMRQAIGNRCRVLPEHVMIHATHTHSGPAVSGRLGMESKVAAYRVQINELLEKAAGAVVEAESRLEASTLAIGYAKEERISFNRRLLCTDGTTQMNWEVFRSDFDPKCIERAWGPIDPEVACLTVQQHGRSVAPIVNFGLHPAILAGDNWLYSADYPGFLADALVRSPDGFRNSLFLNGCCGNVNHVDYRNKGQGRGFPMAQRVGEMLAETAIQAIGSSTSVEGDLVQASRRLVVLDRMQISDDQYQWCERVMNDARSRPPAGQVDGLPDAYFAQLRLEMRAIQQQTDEVEVMVLRLGDVALVGLPGEAFCELGLTIKSRSPARHTLVAGLANDAIGYLPTGESFAQGGYETIVGSTFYQPGSAERLVESAVDQLGELFSG
jgi:hypothetical protein